MKYLFDTNIILHYLKGDALMRKIMADFNPISDENEAWLSVVSVGEIRSIALANQWGEKKLRWLEQFIAQFFVADLNTEELLNRYAEIEIYSQCRLPSISPQPFSPRNMGKNDLWIAATASVLGATLLTTDKDFEHLDGVFLKLKLLEA